MKNHLPGKKSVSTLLVILFIALGTGISFAQDADIKDQVTKTLAIAENAANEKGYKKSHNYMIDNLEVGKTDSITVELDHGVSYLLIGVCDDDCEDMDFRVLDSNDKQVASDTEDDSIPVVEYTPETTASFKIEIRMHKCKSSPCYYGIGAFAKDPEPDSSPSDAEVEAEAQRLIDQIIEQLETVETSAKEKGNLTKTHDYIIDRLGEGEKDEITLDLESGMVYMLVGVCDEDCSDIKIKVFDSAGKQLASDSKVGDLPALIVDPSYTGTYKIEISMAKCEVSPCLYGVGVYGK